MIQRNRLLENQLQQKGLEGVLVFSNENVNDIMVYCYPDGRVTCEEPTSIRWDELQKCCLALQLSLKDKPAEQWEEIIITSLNELITDERG